MRSVSAVVVLVAATAVLPAGLAGRAKDVKIKGYVTAVTSPTQFEIEDYRVTRDTGFVLDFENASPDIQLQVADVRVGMDVEVKGTLDGTTGELKARSIKVDLEQFKPHKQTAILSQPPAGVERSDRGWSGTFLVDGQRIQVGPSTELVFKLTGREKKLAKQAKDDAAGEAAFQPLRSLADVSTGMAMTYEGARDLDGTILATRVEFSRNDLEPGEKKIWDSLKITTKAPPAQSLAGELKIDQIGKFRLIADPGVQQYVDGVGARLIPDYQRALPAGDPTKIPFWFFVVEEKTPNAFALPNGIVVIHSSMFDVVQNEAQLAAIVGHEIAHAVQEHTWRQQQHDKGKRTALAIGAALAAAYKQYALSDVLTLVQAAIQNGYSRNLENQSDRLGMEYMVHAGYDPREAPRVWKEMTNRFGDARTDFFWSNHDNHATRRSYLMNELKTNYSRLEYARLSTNEAAFREMAARVRAAAGGKSRLKITD